jgi:CubicO group peptidase (beta-lactamase class C family)
LISAEFLERMRTPTTLNDGTKIDYGFFTCLGNLDGHPVLGHTGGGGGFSTVLACYPLDSLTIVVLCNTENDNAALRLETRLARLILQLPEEEVKDVALTDKESRGWVGDWNSDDGPFTVVLRNGKLYVGATTARPELPLAYEGHDVVHIADAAYAKLLAISGRCNRSPLYIGGMLIDVAYKK